jgi:hypothetical protein
MKVGDLVRFQTYGHDRVGIVIDDNERNHADVRFFVAFSPGWHPHPDMNPSPYHHGYYPTPENKRKVEVINESR